MIFESLARPLLFGAAGHLVPRRKEMNRMVVVIFENQGKAYMGKQALWDLDAEGSVTIYASAVVARNPDGTAEVMDDEPGVLGTLVGTPVGALVGLIGGPAGVAIGAATGLAAGIFADLDNARIGSDFVDDVRTELLPGQAALVAEIDEEWTAPLDTRMEALGGKVYRRSLSEVRDTGNDEDTAAIKADIAQTKAEHAQAHADRKAKLRDRLNRLDSKLQERLQKSKERREAAKRAARVKVQVLKAKAAVAQARAP
jgi:uncharacterized membrane protein